jgi:hypothetical protein
MDAQIQVVKTGLWRRYGAYRNPNDDESTAFASCLGSEFDKTTVTHPSQCDSSSSSNQRNFAEVGLCEVIAENNEEVNNKKHLLRREQ